VCVKGESCKNGIIAGLVANGHHKRNVLHVPRQPYQFYQLDNIKTGTKGGKACKAAFDSNTVAAVS